MKKHILLVVLLALLGMSLTGCSTGRSEVNKTWSTEGSIKQDVLYLMAGKIEVGEKVDLTSKITANVAKMNVDIGSTVQKGESLIQLDAKDLQVQVAQARSTLAQVQASLAGAKADYESAMVNCQRYQQLFQAGAISRSELEQFQNALNAAETKKNVCQAQLEQAQATLEKANIQLVDGAIVTPISGVVSAKEINTGELATAGATLLTVVNPKNILINGYLPDRLLNKVKTGQGVVIKIPELSEKEYAGEILFIDKTVDANNHVVLVKVAFKNQDAQLKPGMFAEVGLRN